ncbi:unnamed protein product [Caretta caretta]
MCAFGRRKLYPSAPAEGFVDQTDRWLLENEIERGAPLSDKNMDLIGIIQYPWKPCSIRLALSCSSVAACSRLMPLLLRPGFHAQVHLVEQMKGVENLLP